jgi:general secretion pathway protein A
MYEAFYGFQEKPFSLLPDPRFLYFSRKHRVALAMLEYGLLNQAGFTVITGEIGAGKTTLIHELLRIADRSVVIGTVSNANWSFGELLKWTLSAYGLEYAGKEKIDLYRDLCTFAEQQEQRGYRTVLVIDEAQNMSPRGLEELRILSNINAGNRQLLQLVLIGQPGLRELLRRPQMEQFAQRIAIDHHLERLGREESREYIRHRLRVAGGPDTLFTEAALDAVHEYTNGTPRMINVVCDTALVCGYADQRDLIDCDLVNSVVEDKRAGGIFPLGDGEPLHAGNGSLQEPAAPPAGEGTPHLRDLTDEPPLPDSQTMSREDFRLLFGQRGRRE